MTTDGLAEKWSIPLADARDRSIELAFDSVHFTEAGRHAYAKQMVKDLQKMGVSP